MNKNYRYSFIQNASLLTIAFLFVLSCNRESSPEGRMSIQIENLQKDLIDSLYKQNQAILDSLGQIRKELEELKMATK
jgi:hypothetical protein